MDERQIRRRLEEPHACIRVYEDDTVLITDQDGRPLKMVPNPEPLKAPRNTYAQALWYNTSPTCIWYCGRLY